MPKPNAFLARQQAKHDWEIKRAREHAIQFSEDIMLIAAHETFGAGADRLLDLHKSFCRVFGEYMELAVSDLADDSEIWYTCMECELTAATKEAPEPKPKRLCGKWKEANNENSGR